jgi:hypothetical protein
MELRVSVVLAEEGRKVLLDIRWSGCRARILLPPTRKRMLYEIHHHQHHMRVAFPSRSLPHAVQGSTFSCRRRTADYHRRRQRSAITRPWNPKQPGRYEVAGRDSDRIDARTMTTARYIGLSHRIFTGRDNRAGSKDKQKSRYKLFACPYPLAIANNFVVERTSNTTVDTDDGSVHLATI